MFFDHKVRVVIGYLTPEKLIEILYEIKNLPKKLDILEENSRKGLKWTKQSSS